MLQCNLDVFLKENRINPEDWQSSNISWDDLLLIGQDHEQQQAALEASAISNASFIQRFNGVHSVRWRVKDSSHLMAKIIRKRVAKEPKYMDISAINYIEVVDDLIGLRALHLFKEDCFEIDREVRAIFPLKENPIAYIREGDNPELIARYEEAGMGVKKHKDNYRSIHYILATKPTLRVVNIELQVRTIFEEGWSEIDHKVRYPNFPNNQHLRGILNILNGMTGQADDTGGLIHKLSKELQSTVREHQDNAEFDETGENIDLVQKEVGGSRAESLAGDPPVAGGNPSTDGEDALFGESEDQHFTADPQTIRGGSSSALTERRPAVLPTTTTGYRPSTFTVAQQTMEKHNAAMNALKNINEVGAVVKAMEERNVAARSFKVLGEHNAAMKALDNINQVGAVAKAMEERNVAARSFKDISQLGAAVKVLEEHDAIKKALGGHDVDVIRKVLGEQDAIKKALGGHDVDVIRKVLDEQDAIKRALGGHDAVRKVLDEQDAVKKALKGMTPPYF